MPEETIAVLVMVAPRARLPATLAIIWKTSLLPAAMVVVVKLAVLPLLVLAKKSGPLVCVAETSVKPAGSFSKGATYMRCVAFRIHSWARARCGLPCGSVHCKKISIG